MQVDYEVHPQHRRDGKEMLPASLVSSNPAVNPQYYHLKLCVLSLLSAAAAAAVSVHSLTVHPELQTV